MFSAEMTLAVRVMWLNRAEAWFTEERLGVLGIAPATVLQLRSLGVTQYRQESLGSPMEWALTEIAAAILEAGRA